jgi:hypothetical protein
MGSSGQLSLICFSLFHHLAATPRYDEVDENDKTLLEDTLWTKAVEKILGRQETRAFDLMKDAMEFSDDDVVESLMGDEGEKEFSSDEVEIKLFR